jgi:hypothetical protein
VRNITLSHLTLELCYLHLLLERVVAHSKDSKASSFTMEDAAILFRDTCPLSLKKGRGECSYYNKEYCSFNVRNLAFSLK